MAKALEVPSDNEEERLKSPADVEEEHVAGDSDGEVEYEIEEIKKARRGLYPGGRVAYYVKWKGYDDSENSWVDEKDAGNATALIAEFWERERLAKSRGPRSSTGKARKPRRSAVDGDTPDESASVSKKRGRKSITVADSDLEDDGSEKVRRVRKRERNDDREKEAEPVATGEEEELFQDMSDYMHLPDWGDIVTRVDTVERMKDGGLTVYFQLKNGERVKESSKICSERFPQKLIRFYESNLRWKTAD